MTEVTMLEFDRDSRAIIRKVQQGTSVLLTEDGEPVIRLEPAGPGKPDPETKKSLLSYCELGERLVPPGPITELTNEEIDRLVYGL